MYDIPSSSNSAKGVTKIILFSMETPCWSPSEGLLHGGRKPVETSGVYFGSFNTFLRSVKFENFAYTLLSAYCLLRTRKHNAKRCFRALNMLPRDSGDVANCEKNSLYFRNKVVYRDEERSADIYLKMTFQLMNMKTQKF